MAGEYPRLRIHRRKTNSGIVEWYYYDMRGKGQKDIPLGCDKQIALEKWVQIHNSDTTLIRRKTAANSELFRPAVLLPRREGRRRKFREGTWDGMPPWTKRVYLNAEKRSIEKGRGTFLTLNEFRSIVERAGGRCEVTGIAFQPGTRNAFAPSLDRINSAAGYVFGNVRLVCLIVNQALGDWGEEALTVMAKAYLSAKKAEQAFRV